MTANDLLIRLTSATTHKNVFVTNNPAKEYKEYLKLIHPDVCMLANAHHATTLLNQFFDAYQSSLTYPDDAGTTTYTNHSCTTKGNDKLLELSYQNYKKLTTLNDPASLHFKQYLPQSGQLVNGLLTFTTPNRIVPLYNLQLPQKHVCWIFSRLIEFVGWLHQNGYSHNGINPASFYIVPQTHGLICTSFYHLTRLDAKLNTISAAHKSWYPNDIFIHKKTTQNIDLELAQRTAIYLLGDQSGNGIKLKKSSDINQTLLDFWLTPHHNSYDTYTDYRQLLQKLFGKPQFHVLDL